MKNESTAERCKKYSERYPWLTLAASFLARLRRAKVFVALLYRGLRASRLPPAILLAPLCGALFVQTPRGTITGMLKGADGRPVFGVRVSALARPESREEAIIGTDLVSIAQTDQEGRFRLEDIPPGQYYIVAGRVDLPTYYPGTPQMASATLVKVTPGAALAGIDFSINNSSFRSEATDLFRAAVGRRSIPIRVVMDDAGRVPISSASGNIMVEFERAIDGAVTAIPVAATNVVLEYLIGSPFTEYQLTVRNLPDGYAVKSVVEGTIDITANTLKVAPAGVQPVTVTLSVSPVPGLPGGVRITGLGRPGSTRAVYLSGIQGAVFADGTFEFRNVPPGRHTLATIDFPGKARGTTVVVGAENLDNVTLQDVSNLPVDIQTPKAPGPAGDRPPGTRFAPVNLRARVVDDKTRQPVISGELYLSSRSSPAIPLDAEGRFAIQNLLPGVYSVEILIFGYATVNQEIVVGVEDLEVELTSQKMF